MPVAIDTVPAAGDTLVASPPVEIPSDSLPATDDDKSALHPDYEVLNWEDIEHLNQWDIPEPVVPPLEIPQQTITAKEAMNASGIDDFFKSLGIDNPNSVFNHATVEPASGNSGEDSTESPSSDQPQISEIRRQMKALDAVKREDKEKELINQLEVEARDREYNPPVVSASDYLFQESEIYNEDEEDVFLPPPGKKKWNTNDLDSDDEFSYSKFLETQQKAQTVAAATAEGYTNNHPTPVNMLGNPAPLDRQYTPAAAIQKFAYQHLRGEKLKKVDQYFRVEEFWSNEWSL